MIIECSSCHSRYQYDEERFERKPSKKIKCAKCGTIFEAHNPAFATKPSAAIDADMTSIRGKKTTEQAASRFPEEEEEKPPAKVVLTPQLPAGKRLSLAIINGTDAGNVYRIEKPRVIIGRSGADVNLNDTESSRHHAALEVRDTTFLLEDLQSKNGTLIDGQKITSAVELQNQSEFQIGSTTIMLIVAEDV